MAVTRDDSGNVQVDFVWGNFPLQPDADRGENTLDPTLDNHSIATTGYSNFPGFIPNYAGDGDTGFETVLPQLLRLSRNAAQDALTAANLGNLDISWVNYDLSSVVSSGKTVTFTVASDHLLVAGDTVSVYYNDGNGFNGVWAGVKITKVIDNRNFQFKLATAPNPALEFNSTGYVFNNDGIVLAVDGTAGDILNRGTDVPVLILNGD